MRLSFRSHPPARTPADRRRQSPHQLTRDAVEAEDIAVRWLRARGFDDAHRMAPDRPLGIRGAGVRAYVSFDPLPMEADVLKRIVAESGESEVAVCFTFAGWSPQAQAWADQHDVPLIRFTFAGTTDPSNDAARRLDTS